jgi:hypothetical protein
MSEQTKSSTKGKNEDVISRIKKTADENKDNKVSLY